MFVAGITAIKQIMRQHSKASESWEGQGSDVPLEDRVVPGFMDWKHLGAGSTSAFRLKEIKEGDQ
jgi:hypothetical protein